MEQLGDVPTAPARTIELHLITLMGEARLDRREYDVTPAARAARAH